MRWIPLAVKVTVALAAGGFLTVSLAMAKPPRPAADPPVVRQVPVTERQARDLTRLTERPRSSPTPAPTRGGSGPSPVPTPPDLPVDEDEDEDLAPD
ncbi:hypothetical protein Lfu02_70740 [Longispora fulva]|uniref:Uncharacterized protein n=1 Tax=Longispora fulva TaxID=619741 RepID=A0A8J7KMT3_9ACTN|nr:hypothetical protein [Longispora fulva]MBG6134382.1 hypothetical protein [Longispora fulva]GIG62702.1 hypothetical protein Lfu02_70740 [Longispora fulva]